MQSTPPPLFMTPPARSLHEIRVSGYPRLLQASSSPTRWLGNAQLFLNFGTCEARAKGQKRRSARMGTACGA